MKEDESDNFQVKRSQPWPMTMTAKESSETFNSFESFSSISSEKSFGSTSDKTEDDSRKLSEKKDGR